MRKSKFVRRRNIYFVSFLFIASLFCTYETHSGMFFKKLAVQALAKALPENTRVDISSVKGGIFKNLVSENVRIFPWPDEMPLNIEKIELNYRLWYPLFGKVPTLPEGKFLITQGKGFIELEILKEEGKVIIKDKINHIKFHGIDFIARCNATIDGIDKSSVNIHVVLKDMIIDYMPFRKDIEIFATFDKAKDTFNITGFRMGGDIKGHGFMRVKAPKYLFLTWAITDLIAEEYLALKNIKEDVKGKINGSFTIEGLLKELRLSGHVDIQEGNFGNFKFNSIIGNLKGKGPFVTIYDTRIFQADGYFTLKGDVDLRKLKDKDAFDGISFEEGEPEGEKRFLGVEHEVKF